MIPYSKAYINFKKQAQDIIDFIVVVSYGVPALKENIKAIKNGTMQKLNEPDYFKWDKTTEDKMKLMTNGYQQKMAKYLIISSVSFFESYIKNVLNELVEFHGGKDQFIQISYKKTTHFMRNEVVGIKDNKRKLQEKIDKAKLDKYKKYTTILLNKNYKFPTDLFSTYGLKQFIEKIDSLRVNDIPDFLKYTLHVDIEKSSIEKYTEIREIRNSIAHGKRVEVSLKKAIEYNNFLRDFALKIDKQIIEYYFIIEEFSC